MDCRDLSTLAVDRLTGEADEGVRAELAAHLAACEGCRAEMAELESIWATLGSDPDASVSPEFRRRSLALLEEEMLRQRVRAFRPRPRMMRPLLQAAALLVAAGLGFLAAKGLPHAVPAAAAAVAKTPVASAALPNLESGPRLSNVSFQPPDKDGRVGIGFDVTTRQTIQGSSDEPEVARLLAYLVSHNAETAGEKSRAIELVSEHYGASKTPAAPEIVAALASTLRKDANPGVRKKAADALAGFPMSPEIRTAFLEALHSDKNPAVRLVAVDALAAAAKQTPDPSTIQSLREKAVDPQENGYVRAKAASALKAISF
jgi:HEAT repeat protein